MIELIITFQKIYRVIPDFEDKENYIPFAST